MTQHRSPKSSPRQILSARPRSCPPPWKTLVRSASGNDVVKLVTTKWASTGWTGSSRRTATRKGASLRWLWFHPPG